MSFKPTEFEDTYKFSQDAFKALEGKQGFELYQTFRDALFSLLFNKNESAEKFIHTEFNDGEFAKFNLVDQKYIDNFILCMTVRLNAPSSYEEMKKIIDKNIVPDKRSQGMSNVYKEMSGALVLFLNLYEDITIRQADKLVSQLFGVAQNIPHAQYLKQRENIKLLSSTLPSDYVLALLFFCLQNKNTKIENLKPIVEKNKRSEDEFQKAINGYLVFKKKIFDFYIERLEPLLDTEETILDVLKNEFEMNIHENDDPSEFEVLILICVSLGMKLMPNFIYQPEAFIKFLEK